LRKPLAQGVRKLAVGLGAVIGVPHLFEMKDDGGGMFAGKADRAGADAAEPVALVEHQRLAVAIAAGAAAARLDEAILLAHEDDAVFIGVLPPSGQGSVGKRQLPAGRQVGEKVTGHGSAARRDGAPGPSRPVALRHSAGARRSSSASSVLKRSSGRSMGTWNLNTVAPSNL